MVELTIANDNYVYLNLTSKDLLGMFKTNEDLDRFNKKIIFALEHKNAKMLYVTLKDVLICSLVTCERSKIHMFGKKELWKNLLFSRSDMLHKILDIFLGNITLAQKIMNLVVVDDGQIHEFDLRELTTMVDSKEIEKEMNI